MLIVSVKKRGVGNGERDAIFALHSISAFVLFSQLCWPNSFPFSIWVLWGFYFILDEVIVECSLSLAKKQSLTFFWKDRNILAICSFLTSLSFCFIINMLLCITEVFSKLFQCVLARLGEVTVMFAECTEGFSISVLHTGGLNSIIDWIGDPLKFT